MIYLKVYETINSLSLLRFILSQFIKNVTKLMFLNVTWYLLQKVFQRFAKISASCSVYYSNSSYNICKTLKCFCQERRDLHSENLGCESRVDSLKILFINILDFLKFENFKKNQKIIDKIRIHISIFFFSILI